MPRLPRSLQWVTVTSRDAVPLLSSQGSQPPPSLSLDKEGPRTRTGGAFPSRVGALLGSLNPGLALGSLDSLGGHLGYSLQAPVASCREVVLVAAQVQSLQPGTHRAKGGEGREGTVCQGGGRPGEQRNHSQSTTGVWPQTQSLS